MKYLRILIITIGLLLPLISLAVQVEFEVGYPTFEGEGGTIEPGGGPAGWIRYIFLFSLGILGVVAVGNLVYAGILWMTSGATDKVKEAKDRIWGSVLGILLVVGSVLLLRTINPDLIRLQNPNIQDGLFNGNVDIDTQFPVSGQPGSACNANGGCPSSLLVCDTPTNTCRIRESQSCEENKNLCESGTTCGPNNRCQRPPDPGAANGSLSGSCRSAEPRCNSGLMCTSNNVCKKSPNQICSDTSECAVGLCIDTNTSSGKRCLLGGN